ncbi:hypothetical protein AOA57_02565 [Pseudomonas sp. 2588-5]|nr:hypothetical protein AOA57_02565 [Pseudomonas sp. 2588-5]
MSSNDYMIINDDGSTTGVASDVDIFEYAKQYGGKVILKSDYIAPPYVATFEELALIENQWREDQMVRVANQLLMLEDDDPDAEPGTARQWRDYRIELRKWTETNPDFPNSSKRPVAPS